ncbi:MAG: YggT family protein [Anaerolineales bacterium]
MLLQILITAINVTANLLVLLLIVNAVLSFFVSPYHPIRQALDRLLDPLLAPVRRIVPPVGMFDFSPLVLILVIQVLSYVLISLLNFLLR